MTSQHKTTLLTILNGFGLRKTAPDNAISQANTPVWDSLLSNHPSSKLDTSGPAVGLPEGQMGNSEVGHMSLGSGRMIQQNLTRINQAIKKGSFYKNPVLTSAIDQAVKKNAAVHIIGLLSPGGVHSHEAQLLAACKLAKQQGAKKLFVHAILDGRDEPPKSAKSSLDLLHQTLKELKLGHLATIIGRYYGMDRDNRWERTETFYNALTNRQANFYSQTGLEALTSSYQRGDTDEFVNATLIGDKQSGAIQDNDSVLFMNFRPDRARQLSHAFVDGDNFKGFSRAKKPKLSAFVTLTEYDATLECPCAFLSTVLRNDIGEYLSTLGKTQLRMAETEKHAHVTFFFSGGTEIPYLGEERVLINSPDVATYDLQPEMSALELTDKLIEAIKSNQYDFIVCNYANADMVGHTGVFSAAVKAVECLDQCLGLIERSVSDTQAHWFITADHGNIEQMINPESQSPLTSHTTGPVPFVYIHPKKHSVTLRNGTLCDVAPTLLDSMNIPCPDQMTGSSLLNKTLPTEA